MKIRTGYYTVIDGWWVAKWLLWRWGKTPKAWGIRRAKMRMYRRWCAHVQ